MSNKYDYDSAAVRAAARKIQRCANTVNNDAKPKLKNVRNEVSSEFEGAAANALEERLGDLDSDIRSIANGLSSLSEALFDYADALDEAMEAAKEVLEG